jgi:CBS domain-containing protein
MDDGRRFDVMMIRDYMDQNITTLLPSATVYDAMKVISDSAVPVVVIADGSQLLGIVSEWDITARALTENWDDQRTALNTVARRLPFCFEDDSPEDVAFLMWMNKTEHLVVVNDLHQPVGYVTSRHLLKMRWSACSKADPTSEPVQAYF